MAGQRRQPHRNRAATERPEGNQTSVAKLLTAPRDRPSRPVPKYTTASVNSVIAYQRAGASPILPALLCRSCHRTFHFICSYAPFIVSALGDVGTTSKKLAGKQTETMACLSSWFLAVLLPSIPRLFGRPIAGRRVVAGMVVLAHPS